MLVLFNGEILEDDEINLNVLSPFLNYAAGIKECMLYREGDIWFYEAHKQKVLDSVAKLNLNFQREFASKEKILELIKQNRLDDKEVLIKYYCLENYFGCDSLVLVTEYKRDEEPFNVILHFEPRFGQLYKFNLISRFEEYYWFEFFAERFEKFSPKEFLLPNYKGQIVGGFKTNVLAVWNKNLYYVDSKQPYFETVMQERILKDFTRLGLKRLIVKSKGFSLDFLKRVDEVILVNDLLIAVPVKLLIRTKSAYSEPSYWEFRIKDYSVKIRNFYLKLFS